MEVGVGVGVAVGVTVFVGVAVFVTVLPVTVTVGVRVTTFGVTVTVARGAGVVEAVERPTSPSTDVPVPDRPRTTSLSGRPTTISTTVTTTSTPTKRPAHAAANVVQPRRGASGVDDAPGGRGASPAAVPTRRSEWLYTALPTTVRTLATAAPMTVPAMPR